MTTYDYSTRRETGQIAQTYAGAIRAYEDRRRCEIGAGARARRIAWEAELEARFLREAEQAFEATNAKPTFEAFARKSWMAGIDGVLDNMKSLFEAEYEKDMLDRLVADFDNTVVFRHSSRHNRDQVGAGESHE